MSGTVDFAAPVPLGHFQAIEKAVELRDQGHPWTWPVISEVMAQYHGFKRSAEWWKRTLRGRVSPRPRGGSPFVAHDARAGQKRGFDPDVRAEAVRRYVAGETCTEVGDALGCAKSSVLDWVRAAGVPTRQWDGHRFVA